MKDLIIIVLILLILSSLVSAKLSDETLEIVDDLWWKHCGLIGLSDSNNIISYDGDFVYEWWSMTFDDETGIFYAETQDGKWFIEMEKVEE